MPDQHSFEAAGRPYLVANFAQTIDGKVQGPGAGYWPVGSGADHELLLDLRAECDVLVHGRLTAMSHEHVSMLNSAAFRGRLKEHGRTRGYVYVVISAHPDAELIQHIDPKDSGLRVIVVTTDGAEVPELAEGVEVWRCGDGEEVVLPQLLERMAAEAWRGVSLEVGPRLFGAFLAAKLVDELFVTTAPKLFGTAFGTPTMINGLLFAPEEVPVLELVSVKAQGSEIFARYRFDGSRA